MFWRHSAKLVVYLSGTIFFATYSSFFKLIDSPGVPAQPVRHPPDLHPPNITLINITNFNIPINRDICNTSKIDLAVIIHSAIGNREGRDVIRMTWGHPNIPHVETRLIFLVGENTGSHVAAWLEREANEFGDLVQGGFVDNYENMSYKNIFGHFWVSTFCPQAEFVIKMDDDMFADLYEVYTFTREYLDHPFYGTNGFLMGAVWTKPIFRDPSNKWYVSYDEIPKDKYPGDTYPPYIRGWFHITNVKTASRLVEAAKTSKFFWIDDVWVTGFIVEELGILHIDTSQYFTKSVQKLMGVKCMQTPGVYHLDFLTGPTKRDYWKSLTLHKHAEWCYYNKCFNNIYFPRANLTETEIKMANIMRDYF